jgi:Lrp/AsnC family leucine-responsive transcriptional regulator
VDRQDRRILSLIQRDGRMPQAEIAKRVGLSAPAVNERMRKLESSGVIRRFGAVVNPASVGVSITAFVEVFIEHPRFEKAYIDRIHELDEVLEAHHVTGEFSLLLKLRVRDMAALQELLLRRLNVLDGVRQTRTVMVLSTIKEETFVPTLVEGDSA